VLRILGSKFTKQKYKATKPARIDDKLPSDSNFINDNFELRNYENQSFDFNNEGFTHSYMDFTGSREVGIDVGPFEEQINYIKPKNESKPQLVLKTFQADKIIEEEKEAPAQNVSNLLNTTSEILAANKRSDDEQFRVNKSTPITKTNAAESAKFADEDDFDKYFDNAKVNDNELFKTDLINDPFYSYELNDDNIQIETIEEEAAAITNKEMSREDFDNLFNQRFSEILDDKNLKGLVFPKDDQQSQSTQEIDEEAESEIANIFNKENMEKNFPDIFGSGSPDSIERNGLKASNHAEIVQLDSVERPIKKYTRNTTAPLGFVPNNDQSDISSVEVDFTENDTDSLKHDERSAQMIDKRLGIEDEYDAVNSNDVIRKFGKLESDQDNQEDDSLENTPKYEQETEEEDTEAEEEQANFAIGKLFHSV
jgi:hypothetical protein